MALLALFLLKPILRRICEPLHTAAKKRPRGSDVSLRTTVARSATSQAERPVKGESKMTTTVGPVPDTNLARINQAATHQMIE